MSIYTILILVLLGIAAGILSGLIGVGGGIIIVPSLIYFLSFSQKSAQGTSLGLLLLPVGILGVIEYYKEGHVDLKIVLILAVGFLAGSYFGSKIALSLPQETLKKIFAVILILVAVKMLFFDKPSQRGRANLNPDAGPVPSASFTDHNKKSEVSKPRSERER